MLSEIVKAWVEAGLYVERTIPTPSFELAHLLDVVFNDQNKPAGYNPRHNYNPLNIVMLSGGLDSTVMWYNTPEPKIGYYIDIGQAYAEKEKASLRKNKIPFEEIHIVIDGIKLKDWYYTIPARNLLFISTVAEKHPLNMATIFMASNDGEMPVEGGDKSLQFISLTNQLLKPFGKVVSTPFMYMTKTEEVELGIRLGVKDQVMNTISCLEGEDGRCGTCQSCFRTWVAFSNNGIDLPFNKDPVANGTKHIEKYQKNMTEAVTSGNYDHYSMKRIREMENALAKVGIKLIQS